MIGTELDREWSSLLTAGNFGYSRFEYSLRLCEPLEDVSSYMFQKPLDGILSLSDFCLRDNINGMYKKVEQSPKTYFFCPFEKMNSKDTKLDALNMIFSATQK